MVCRSLGGTEQELALTGTHGTHRIPVIAAAAVHALAARLEVEVPRADRVVQVQHTTRPVVAVHTRVGGRKEDALAVSSNQKATIHPI